MGRSRSERGRLSRRKGRAFEQFVARALRPYYSDARRQPQSQIKQLKNLAQHNQQLANALCITDVVAGPFGIECKHRKVLPPIQQTLAQAQADVGKSGQIPVAVHRPSPGQVKDIVVYCPHLHPTPLPWAQFLKMLPNLPAA